MAFGYPSGTNTFVPTFDATGHLIASYSRNPKDFALNRYITLTPVKKQIGYYLRLDKQEAARVINNDAAEFIWPDGNDAPDAEWGTEQHQFFSFECKRYAYGFRIGYLALEQADWKIDPQHTAIKAQQAMTARTTFVVNQVLESTGLYDALHNQTFKTWGDNATFANAGTSTNPVVQLALENASKQIHLDTIGVVQPRDLVLVMNPNSAIKIATSAEIHDYVKMPAGLSLVKGTELSPRQNWGLPAQLYGYDVVVEDAVRVTSKKGATLASGYVLPDNTAYLIARPGGLEGNYGSPSFSAVHLFSYEEMTVETKDDPDNRRVRGRVIENFDSKMVSPSAIVRISNLFS